MKDKRPDTTAGDSAVNVDMATPDTPLLMSSLITPAMTPQTRYSHLS